MPMAMFWQLEASVLTRLEAVKLLIIICFERGWLQIQLCNHSVMFRADQLSDYYHILKGNKF